MAKPLSASGMSGWHKANHCSGLFVPYLVRIVIPDTISQSVQQLEKEPTQRDSIRFDGRLGLAQPVTTDHPETKEVNARKSRQLLLNVETEALLDRAMTPRIFALTTCAAPYDRTHIHAVTTCRDRY